MSEHSLPQIKLPEQLVSSVDLSRVIRELEALDESIRQANLRKPGEPTKLSRSSITLEDIARLNKIALTDEKQRSELLTAMKAFLQYAPRIHMSVAAEPSPKFNQRVLVWLRENIHPLVLLEIGLQPTLAAGCIVRTDNKLFDMSLRHRFKENRHLLVEKISEVAEAKEAKAPKPAPPATPAPAATAQVSPQESRGSGA